jgi:hypothetical protein
MASTIQALMLKLALRVDPFVKSTGVLETSATIGVAGATGDGDKFSAQRLLDVYNESRLALFSALYESKTSQELSKLVSASFITASITLTYASPNTTAPKPSGFLKLVSLTAPSSIPIIVIPNNWLGDIRKGTDPHLTVSASNILAVELTTNFLIVGNFGAGTGIIDYYGITNWALSDVTTGTAVEVFSTELEPMLLDLAVAISLEQGNQDAIALAKKLIGGQ